MKTAEGSVSVLCLPGRSTITLEVCDEAELFPTTVTAQLTVEQAKDLIEFLGKAVFIYDTDIFDKIERSIFADLEGK